MEILCLIAALASIALWFVGYEAERRKLAQEIFKPIRLKIAECCHF